MRGVILFYFDDEEEAKGISNGAYTIIWIDNYHSNDTEKLFGVEKRSM